MAANSRMARRGSKPKPKPSLRRGGGIRTIGHWVLQALIKRTPPKKDAPKHKDKCKQLEENARVRISQGKISRAIRILVTGLLKHPKHQAFHALLEEAADIRRLRRLAMQKKKDPFRQLSAEARQEAIQLEAFAIYLKEVEKIIDRHRRPRTSQQDTIDRAAKNSSTQGRREEKTSQSERMSRKKKIRPVSRS